MQFAIGVLLPATSVGGAPLSDEVAEEMEQCRKLVVMFMQHRDISFERYAVGDA